MAADPSDPFRGLVLADKYEVGDLLAEGGMGRVYRAVHRLLDRPVAVKFIQPGLAIHKAVAERFFAEARTSSQLSHPNIVTVFDFGTTDTTAGPALYMVMELLSGSDLATVLDHRPELPIPRIVDLVGQVLAALSEAHQYGIVHRDIKPENVVLEPARRGEVVKVIDFGIAAPKEGRRLTMVGQFVGTPDYMAPEQGRGGKVTAQTDLYAVGVLLYRLLAGRVPFDGSPIEVIRQHQEAPRPDPADHAPNRGISKALSQVVARAMAIDPADRYAGALEMAQALALAGDPVAGASQSPSPQSPSPQSPLPQSLSPQPTSPPSGRRAPPTPEPSARPRRRAAHGWPLVDRVPALSWAEAVMKEPRGIRALLFHGPSGSGRTRLLSEAAAICARIGARGVQVSARPRPLDETGWGTLEDVGAALGADIQARGDDAGPLLTRAVRTALERMPAQRLVLMIDDVDRCDRPSRRAIADFVGSVDDPRVVVLATCAEPESWDVERTRCQPLPGVSRGAALELLGERPLPEGDDLLPLHLEAIDRWAHPDAAATAHAALLEQAFSAVPADARPVLEAVAVAGAAALARVAKACGLGDDACADKADELVGLGWLANEDGLLRVAHSGFADVVLHHGAPEGLRALHTRFAEVHPRDTDLEVHVHHALRAVPDFEAFMAAEQAASMRRTRGDAEGEMAILWDGTFAAQRQFVMSDSDFAVSAWIVLGEKLAIRLIEASRLHEAEGVLTEPIACCQERDPEGVARLVVLANEVARRRGRVEDAASPGDPAPVSYGKRRPDGRWSSGPVARTGASDAPGRSRRRS